MRALALYKQCTASGLSAKYVLERQEDGEFFSLYCKPYKQNPATNVLNVSKIKISENIATDSAETVCAAVTPTFLNSDAKVLASV